MSSTDNWRNLFYFNDKILAELNGEISAMTSILNTSIKSLSNLKNQHDTLKIVSETEKTMLELIEMQNLHLNNVKNLYQKLSNNNSINKQLIEDMEKIDADRVTRLELMKEDRIDAADALRRNLNDHFLMHNENEYDLLPDSPYELASRYSDGGYDEID